MNKGNSVKYHNHYYKAVDEKDNCLLLLPKRHVMVIRAFDGQLFLSDNLKVYPLKLLETHAKVSPEFDPEPIHKKHKPRYKPAYNHPWNLDNFQVFKQLKTKERQAFLKQLV